MVLGVILGAVFGAIIGYVVGWIVELFPSFNASLINGLQALGLNVSSMPGGIKALLTAIGFVLGLLGGIIHMFSRRHY
jgi:putative effector of murein hydrolase